jgi:hypothetical protein
MALHKAALAQGKPYFSFKILQSMKKIVTALSYSAPVAVTDQSSNTRIAANENKPRQIADGARFTFLSDIRPDARYGLSPIVQF